jgi:dGTPase
MEWNKLLNNGRRKDKDKQSRSTQTPDELRTINHREEIERDYDRILFLAPTRRLSDKTQVFPLEQNDSVRTRLTHSHEVSNLARSIGTQLAYENEKIFMDYKLEGHGGVITRTLPSILAAIGLAHDLGNPPFGHQGESAIQSWFNKHAENIFPKNNNNYPLYYNDFLKFDGNSQTMRLLTQLQILNDKFGINLTYGTLAAMLKYPQSSSFVASKKSEIQKNKELNNKNPDLCPNDDLIWSKHGFFYSEQNIIKDIWTETGLSEGVRHPLTYIMEACDDIAYSVLDAEDIVKKRLASFDDLISHLEYYIEEHSQEKQLEEEIAVIKTLIERSQNKKKEFSKPELNLTPAELNDISMQMFRVYAIGSLVEAVTQAFIDHQNKLLDTIHPAKDLMSLSKGNSLCKSLKIFDFKWGYKNESVLKLELQGHNYINGLMDMMWIGIHGRLNKKDPQKSNTPFGKYVYGRISENYRRVFEDKNNPLPEQYKEAQLLTDAISGMTDSYLIDLYNELKQITV